MKRFSGFFRAFGFALSGVGAVLRRERNFRFHLSAALTLAWLQSAYPLEAVERVVLFLAMGSVLGAEMLNTAVEYTVDLLSPGYHPLAKLAKDAAAGGVMVCAFFAALAGLCLLGDWEQLRRIASAIIHHPALAAAVVGWIVAAFLFVFFYGEEQKALPVRPKNAGTRGEERK